MSISTIISDSLPKEIEVNRLQAWRERVLRFLTIILLVLGTPLYILNFRALIKTGSWITIVVISIIYFWVIGITLIRRLSYKFRAVSVAFTMYALIPIAYNLFALSGDGRIWVLFFTIFTTLMLGLRAGTVATIFGILTHFLYGYLMTNQFIPVPAPEILVNNTYQLEGWITTGISLLFVALVLTFSTGLLVRGMDRSVQDLQKTLESERQLSQQLVDDRDELKAQSADLERRVGQIHSAAEISRTLGTILDPQELLQQVVQMISDGFSLYYVAVFLIDDRNRFANLAAGTGEAGRRMLVDGHRLSVGGSSMIGWATANRRPRISQDVGLEAIRFRNPHLPETRSELAIPIVISNEVLGALSIQSAQPDAFDEDDIVVLQGIADSLAIAMENARLFQQFEGSLKEIQQLNRDYLGKAWQEVTLQSEQELSVSVDTGLASGDGESNEINVPMTLRGEQVIGQIVLEGQRAQWTSDEVEFIEAVSNQAALALESARLLEESQKHAERERTLNQLVTRFARSLDFDALLQTVVKELGQLPQVTEAAIHIAPPESENGS